MEIKNLIKPNTVFHCNTQEKADELLKKAHDLKYTWNSGHSYLNKDYWHFRKENSCYYIYEGVYKEIKHCREDNYKIIEYILDKDLEEKSVDKKIEKIIDGKDLLNKKIEVYEDGTMKIHNSKGNFVPKSGEFYYFVDNCGDIWYEKWLNLSEDKWKLKHCKIFKTEKECKEYRNFLEQVDKYSYNFSNEEWYAGRDIDKYTFVYDYEKDDIVYITRASQKCEGAIYFYSEEKREDFIIEVGIENIRKFIFDIYE